MRVPAAADRVPFADVPLAGIPEAAVEARFRVGRAEVWFTGGSSLGCAVPESLVPADPASARAAASENSRRTGRRVRPVAVTGAESTPAWRAKAARAGRGERRARRAAEVASRSPNSGARQPAPRISLSSRDGEPTSGSASGRALSLVHSPTESGRDWPRRSIPGSLPVSSPVSASLMVRIELSAIASTVSVALSEADTNIRVRGFTAFSSSRW